MFAFSALCKSIQEKTNAFLTLFRESDMATIQVLFLGFILLIHNVAMQGVSTNIKGMLRSSSFLLTLRSILYAIKFPQDLCHVLNAVMCLCSWLSLVCTYF